jgi:hypothetical protein
LDRSNDLGTRSWLGVVSVTAIVTATALVLILRRRKLEHALVTKDTPRAEAVGAGGEPVEVFRKDSSSTAWG